MLYANFTLINASDIFKIDQITRNRGAHGLRRKKPDPPMMSKMAIKHRKHDVPATKYLRGPKERIASAC